MCLLFKQDKQLRYYGPSWQLNILEESSGKLLFYSKIYKKFEQQEYLKFHIQKELRKQLTKLRISAHPLAIETGRYSKPKTPHNERF
jgi:hypothetical protein